jgi:lipid-A-disaccharide synthase
LAVVGLVEVIRHIPRIYREYRRLLDAVRRERPDAAILTDSPDFHLRIANRLKQMGIPVIYLVAPQVWAWRKGRLKGMRGTIQRLLCIFPFEERFFNDHGIPALYIGHPLTRLIRPSASPVELRDRFGIAPGTKLVALLPGSRKGEISRHWPVVREAVDRIVAASKQHSVRFIVALPAGANFRERFSHSSIQVLEGQTWDVLACADLALAASGTVTIEAALLGTPLVAFYRVNRLSWISGKLLVRVPFYSMVNLVAEKQVIPELIQDRMTPENLAAEAVRLLEDDAARERMRGDLREVAGRLSCSLDPMEAAASVVEECLKEELTHVS